MVMRPSILFLWLVNVEVQAFTPHFATRIGFLDLSMRKKRSERLTGTGHQLGRVPRRLLQSTVRRDISGTQSPMMVCQVPWKTDR